MPVATLTYDLSDPVEEQEHLYAIKGKDALLSISALDENLRQVLKYQTEGLDGVGSFRLDVRTISWVRQCLREIMEERSLPEVS